MKNKILVLITALFVSGFVLSACSPKTAQPEMEPASPEVAETDAKQAEVSTEEAILDAEQGQVAADGYVLKLELVAETEGQTAYELLEENHELEVKEYDFGVFIEGIDGVKGNDQYYWAFYLNDEYAQKGADQTVLKAGDKVEFRYEEIQF